MSNEAGIIRNICISLTKGTAKSEVPEARLIADWGIEHDAHAGKWHRQISLLPQDKIAGFNARGAGVIPGDFGENLIVEGIDFTAISPGMRLVSGNCVLEITQIGKKCHSHCAIFKKMGECIMPRNGIFAKVIKGGIIRKGDRVTVMEKKEHTGYTAAVITMSDKGAAGQREDESGRFLRERLTAEKYDVIEYLLLPDDEEMLKRELIRLADERQVNLIITTGGTGFSQRDITPEATLAVATRNAPGIAEAIRAESLRITRRAMLSRAASVIRNETLIVNLPGSRKAVEECLDVCLAELGHGLGILLGRDGECGRV